MAAFVLASGEKIKALKSTVVLLTFAHERDKAVIHATRAEILGDARRRQFNVVSKSECGMIRRFVKYDALQA
jgi:hypothetical protein